MVSRRPRARSAALLVAVAGFGALSAAAVAGCGNSATANVITWKRPPAPLAAADAASVNTALAANQRAIAGYDAAGPLLSGAAQQADGWFLGQELSHAGMLRSLVVRLGGTAHEPDANYQLGHPENTHQLIALLGSLERDQINATAVAIGRVHEGVARALLATILADDAKHLIALGSIESTPRPAGAFPTPYAPSIDAADVGRIEDLLRGESVATTAFALSLRSGHLSQPARALAGYLLAQERVHVHVLQRLLAGAGVRQASTHSTGLPIDEILRSTAVRLPRSALGSQRGWIDLFQWIEWRLEGLLYYSVIPRLTGRDALLASSIMASEAEHSVLVAELRRHGDTRAAVPIAIVVGRRWPDQPRW